MMVKCAACGKTISENAKFCPHCGEPSGEEKARVETKEKPKKELERKKIGSKSTDQFVPYRWVFLAFVVILLLIGAWVWYVLDHPTTSSGNRSKQEIPQITQEIKSAAIDQIKAYTRVRDGAILQKGKNIALAIVVDYGTSKSYAKELGDNFVRMIKGSSEDKPPGKKIGKGIYNYTIGVFYPNEKRIVMGAKVTIADHISW